VTLHLFNIPTDSQEHSASSGSRAHIVRPTSM
jgi:hypothetical protein